MRVVVTGWALTSYMELRRAGVIDHQVYASVLRPDAERLKTYDAGRARDARFRDPRFWGPAQLAPNDVVTDGWKMKWHNLGNGNVQLRLCVAVLDDTAFLCHGYLKSDPRQDLRMGAKLAQRIEFLRDGRYTEEGDL